MHTVKVKGHYPQFYMPNLQGYPSKTSIPLVLSVRDSNGESGDQLRFKSAPEIKPSEKLPIIHPPGVIVEAMNKERALSR